MLIVNDDHRQLAGVASLEERCSHCCRPLAAYPLIMSDNAERTVYHVTCALDLATDIMVDLYTFFCPPAPYSQLFVLTAPEAVSLTRQHSERALTEGVIHAGNDYSPDYGPIWAQAFIGRAQV